MFICSTWAWEHPKSSWTQPTEYGHYLFPMARSHYRCCICYNVLSSCGEVGWAFWAGWIAFAKLVFTFRSRLSPLLTAATCNVAPGQPARRSWLWNLHNDGAGMSQADTSPGHTGGICAAAHRQRDLGWALCTQISRSAPNSFSKRLLLLCLQMLQRMVCQLWHRTSNNKAGLWLFPLVILSNCFKRPDTAFGNVLGKGPGFCSTTFSQRPFADHAPGWRTAFAFTQCHFFHVFWQQKMPTASGEAHNTLFYSPKVRLSREGHWCILMSVDSEI